MDIFEEKSFTSKLKENVVEEISNLVKHTSDEDHHSLLKKNSDEVFSLINKYNLNFTAPRWPIECQVLDETIQPIPYATLKTEPFYVITGKEEQPRSMGKLRGAVVYDYPVSDLHFFHRSSIPGKRQNTETLPKYKDSLEFESRFESGNLAKAVRIHEGHYELYLRNDLYTSKHAQWFYFKVTNMKTRMTYRLSIVNLNKEGSLYKEGLRPLMYSTKDAIIRSVGWRRCGNNISYYSNKNELNETDYQHIKFIFTFTIEFPYENDVVFFAYSYPYTYSDLQCYLFKLITHPKKSQFTTLRILCKTLAGNDVYYVTIAAPENKTVNNRPIKSKSKETTKKKKVIVLTARVHPGEPPSSWIMKGILDFLTSNSSAARQMREEFIFKLIPMLNPDGVIVGNSRCSLSGKDLNRQYKIATRNTFPSIWYTKLMIERTLIKSEIAMYCDLHAHSKSHNIFLYGCENDKDLNKQIEEQVFSLMLHKNASNKFSFKNCQFDSSKSKEGTGRVVIGKMGISNSFTLEASFGGSRLGNRAETLFSFEDYETMGHSFCKTLLDFYDKNSMKKAKRQKLKQRLMNENPKYTNPINKTVETSKTVPISL